VADPRLVFRQAQTHRSEHRCDLIPEALQRRCGFREP
jgi:hypothetical protein